MGHVSFRGRSLLTAPGRVTTPRASTEQLVEQALDHVGERPARVVDVGTGSGAVAVAIAAAAPNARVLATDNSPAAVAIARESVRANGLADRVTVLRGDLLAPVPGSIDVVVANLPYLPGSHARRYPDLAGEPPAAVFAPGDGLDPYRRLLTALRGAVDRRRRRLHPAPSPRPRSEACGPLRALARARAAAAAA